tara:strand:+ start:238 stop:1395 length:1158 start_codon:yes stop_codon:yes gene_type:complete
MKTLPDNSVDAIVSDPPYGISFMAKKWDYDVPSVEVWKEAMRVLKPGGHALIACGTRTQHRMVVNIEDAGFEIRDVVSWIYGSGFPKSLNVSKAIDKAAGAERELIPRVRFDGKSVGKNDEDKKGWCVASDGDLMSDPTPATESAKQWDGWGTALKPACEFFTLCRKPLSEKTIAANVLKWGTGGINIDGCRVGTGGGCSSNGDDSGDKLQSGAITGYSKPSQQVDGQGRFPANLIHDGSDEVLAGFPETKSGAHKAGQPRNAKSKNAWTHANNDTTYVDNGSKGSAARFFYCAKASKKDRDEGNHHPTVKPTALMAYLCRLITPTGGTVLDPFMGSGSTGKAAISEGFDFVGCELDADYYAIATARIEAEQNREPEEPDQKELF